MESVAFIFHIGKSQVSASGYMFRRSTGGSPHPPTFNVLRYRSFEQQRAAQAGSPSSRAAIALRITVYIDRAVRASELRGQSLDPEMLRYRSPLGWEHINLTGDYHGRARGRHQEDSGHFEPQTLYSAAKSAKSYSAADAKALTTGFDEHRFK